MDEQEQQLIDAGALKLIGKTLSELLQENTELVAENARLDRIVDEKIETIAELIKALMEMDFEFGVLYGHVHMRYGKTDSFLVEQTDKLWELFKDQRPINVQENTKKS